MMPAFYFDIDDGRQQTKDLEGQELPDREAARKAAVTVLPAMAADLFPNGTGTLVTVRVRDESRRVILVGLLAVTTVWID